MYKRHLENHWLLQQVAGVFVAGKVDGVLLRELDEDDLSELGVDSGIARKKILLALAQLSDATYDGAGWSVRSTRANPPGAAKASAHSPARLKSVLLQQHGGPAAVSSSDDDSDG